MKIKDIENSSYNIGGGVSAAKYGDGSMDYTENKSRATSKRKDSEIIISITNEAIYYPFAPKNLYWYQNEPSWQRMVQQRFLGMKTYSLQVSSKSSNEISSSNSESLKAALRVLFVKLNVQYNEKLEKIFKEDEETKWKIEVRFKSLSSYGSSEPHSSNNDRKPENSSAETFNTNRNNRELAYRESCIKLIKTRKIPDTIAIELNRLRDQLNIPISTAERIEEEIKSKIKNPWYKKLF